MKTHNDPCLECGIDTLKLITFTDGTTSTIGINRLPTDDGYLCGNCAGFECDSCGQRIYLDEDITVEEDDETKEYAGHTYKFHYDCLTPEMKAKAIKQGELEEVNV